MQSKLFSAFAVVAMTSATVKADPCVNIEPSAQPNYGVSIETYFPLEAKVEVGVYAPSTPLITRFLLVCREGSTTVVGSPDISSVSPLIALQDASNSVTEDTTTCSNHRISYFNISNLENFQARHTEGVNNMLEATYIVSCTLYKAPANAVASCAFNDCIGYENNNNAIVSREVTFQLQYDLDNVPVQIGSGGGLNTESKASISSTTSTTANINDILLITATSGITIFEAKENAITFSLEAKDSSSDFDISEYAINSIKELSFEVGGITLTAYSESTIVEPSPLSVSNKLMSDNGSVELTFVFPSLAFSSSVQTVTISGSFNLALAAQEDVALRRREDTTDTIEFEFTVGFVPAISASSDATASATLSVAQVSAAVAGLMMLA